MTAEYKILLRLVSHGIYVNWKQNSYHIGWCVYGKKMHIPRSCSADVSRNNMTIMIIMVSGRKYFVDILLDILRPDRRPSRLAIRKERNSFPRLLRSYVKTLTTCCWFKWYIGAGFLGTDREISTFDMCLLADHSKFVRIDILRAFEKMSFEISRSSSRRRIILANFVTIY